MTKGKNASLLGSGGALVLASHYEGVPESARIWVALLGVLLTALAEALPKLLSRR